MRLATEIGVQHDGCSACVVEGAIWAPLPAASAPSINTVVCCLRPEHQFTAAARAQAVEPASVVPLESRN
jgi:hypothetical protein